MENSSMESTLDTIAMHGFNPVHLAIFLVFVMPLWFISVAGNAVILVSICRYKTLHRPSYYLIAALSLSDITYPLIAFAPATYLAFVKNHLTCMPIEQFYLLLPSSISTVASFTMLVTLSAERYCSIAFPIFHRKAVTSRRVFGITVLNWVICVLASPALLYPYSDNELHAFSSCSPYTLRFIIIVTCFGFSGLIFLSAFNLHFLVLIKRRFRTHVTRNKSPQENKTTRSVKNTYSSGTKASKAVSIIVAFFTLCWLPETLYLILEGINYRRDTTIPVVQVGRKVYVAIFVLNGAINPLVYARQVPHFRSAWRKLLGKPTNRVTNITQRHAMNMKVNTVSQNQMRLESVHML